MYVADLARAVSGAVVGGLLLEESPANGNSGPTDVELYRPLLNVAKHYRWPLVLRLGSGNVVESPALREIDVFIAAANFPNAGSAHGIDVSRMVWLGQPLPQLSPTQFYFIDIPKDAMPEHVLDSLAKLKAGGC